MRQNTATAKQAVAAELKLPPLKLARQRAARAGGATMSSSPAAPLSALPSPAAHRVHAIPQWRWCILRGRKLRTEDHLRFICNGEGNVSVTYSPCKFWSTETVTMTYVKQPMPKQIASNSIPHASVSLACCAMTQRASQPMGVRRYGKRALPRCEFSENIHSFISLSAEMEWAMKLIIPARSKSEARAVGYEGTLPLAH